MSGRSTFWRPAVDTGVVKRLHEALGDGVRDGRLKLAGEALENVGASGDRRRC